MTWPPLWVQILDASMFLAAVPFVLSRIQARLCFLSVLCFVHFMGEEAKGNDGNAAASVPVGLSLRCRRRCGVGGASRKVLSVQLQLLLYLTLL